MLQFSKLFQKVADSKSGHDNGDQPIEVGMSLAESVTSTASEAVNLDVTIGGSESLANSALSGTSARPSTKAILNKELSLVEYGPMIYIHKIDLNQRHFIFQTDTLKHLVYLDVRFPESYPSDPPGEKPILDFVNQIFHSRAGRFQNKILLFRV